MNLNTNTDNIKIFNKNLCNHQNKINFRFFFFKNIIFIYLIIFIVIISKNECKNNRVKNFIKDNDDIIFKKNWRFIKNEHSSKNILFSIIIPVYNTENWIEECLFSVLSQSIKEIEIICVNDGSIDKSEEIIKKIASKENRIILINQKNKGLPAARNSGLKFSIGEYILFLDSDDMFRYETLKDLLNIAKKEKVEVIYFDAFVFFMPGMNYDIRKVNYYRRNKSYGLMSGKDLFSNIIMNEKFSDSACLMMIKRTWLNNNKIKFIEGIIYEDCIFSLQVMMKANYVYHINEKFYIYRIRPNSIMNTKIKPINLFSRIIDFRELIKLYINNNFTSFQKEALFKFINEIKNSIVYFYKIVNKNEWEIFCNKNPVSINEKILLIILTQIIGKINYLENFFKLMFAKNVEIYGIKGNRILEYYNMINKGEIIKGYIIPNSIYNISYINGKKVRILNDDKNIDKNETIIISIEKNKINQEKYKLNNFGFKNIIINDDNLNIILSKLISVILKQKYLKCKINFFKYFF